MNATTKDASGRYLPILYPEEMPYWRAAKQHKLVLQRCDGCGKVWFPIGPTCPFCQSNTFTWTQMSGRGIVHSYVIYHKAWIPYYRDKVPYALVQVEIEEGPRLTTNLWDVPVDQIRIGMKVEASWEDMTDEITLLQFQRAKG
jgi:uncharacterized OB-fold protein